MVATPAITMWLATVLALIPIVAVAILLVANIAKPLLSNTAVTSSIIFVFVFATILIPTLGFILIRSCLR